MQLVYIYILQIGAVHPLVDHWYCGRSDGHNRDGSLWLEDLGLVEFRHRNAATVAAALTGFVERLEAKVDDDDGIHEELRYETCDYYSDMYYPRVGNGYDGDGKPELLDGEEYFDEADRFDLEYRTRRD